MHAALISLILMSGACGQLPTGEMIAPAPEVNISLAERDPFWSTPSVTVSVPPLRIPAGCGAIGCQSCNDPGTPMYHCCHNTPPGPCTTPAWETGYHPACYFYPNHRLLFDPADYTIPYDYREQFNYSWHDPRCPCAALLIGN